MVDSLWTESSGYLRLSDGGKARGDDPAGKSVLGPSQGQTARVNPLPAAPLCPSPGASGD